jgi:hypothetical protein
MNRRCEHEACNASFDARRSDTRYCSPTCRANASRARRMQEAQTDEAQRGTPSVVAPRPPPERMVNVPVRPQVVVTPQRDHVAAKPTQVATPVPQRGAVARIDARGGVPVRADDARLAGLEQRVEALHAALRASEVERGRAEPFRSTPATLDEAAVRAVVAPLLRELKATQDTLRVSLSRLEGRLAQMEARPMPSHDEEGVEELLDRVEALTERVDRLRGEFDELVEAMAGAG